MTQHTELIAQLKALGIPDWATARWLMAKAADAIEALESERDDLRSQVESLNVGFNNCQKERDGLQAQLAAAQGQKPVAWIDAFDNINHADSETDESKIGRDPLYAAPIPQQPSVPEGWKLVPETPTEAMWGELARDIVGWLYSAQSPHYGSKLHTHLRYLGRDIPTWLCKEIPDAGYTPAKGDFAVAIYKAMLEAAPQPKEPK